MMVGRLEIFAILGTFFAWILAKPLNGLAFFEACLFATPCATACGGAFGFLCPARTGCPYSPQLIADKLFFLTRSGGHD